MPKEKKHKKFTFIDLFAGIGGFRSALTYLNGECLFSNEWDKYAAETYKAWYCDEEISTDDIRSINYNLIPSHDILCAGFPCQPFSLAGVSKKQSLGRKHGFEDEKQGNLFFAIRDIAKIKRPKVLFLENVKHLRGHDKGNTMKVIEEEISAMGYKLFSEIVSSETLVPQKRQRIFMVAFDTKVFGDNIDFIFPSFEGERITMKKILEKDVDDKYTLSDNLWNYLKSYSIKQKEKGNGFGFGLVGPDDVARTMSARYYKDGAEILINQIGRNPRKLTPKEAKYLMGFDDKFAKLFGHQKGFPQVVSDMQSYKQFGNSVVPLVVERIAREIIDKL